MAWGVRFADRIKELLLPRWEKFREIGGYNSTKYPEDVYTRVLRPKSIDEYWIRESLLWKYGKWQQWNDGKRIPPQHTTAIGSFIGEMAVLISLLEGNEPAACQESLRFLPPISSIFLSHLLFPDYWAIVDIHTERSLEWIRLQIDESLTPPSNKWLFSRELNEFEGVLGAILRTEKREIDKFMMTFGKNLRYHNEAPPAQSGEIQNHGPQLMVECLRCGFSKVKQRDIDYCPRDQSALFSRGMKD